MPRNWKWGHKKKSGYRSGLEEKVAKILDDKGVPFLYESIKLTYSKTVRRGKCQECGASKVIKEATYTPDFVLGPKRVIEVKGRLTATDRTKLIAVHKSNPTVTIYLYFGSDNKLQKNNNTRYSEWATKHGFDFSINSIPRRWLSGRQSKDGIRDEEDPSGVCTS